MSARGEQLGTVRGVPIRSVLVRPTAVATCTWCRREVSLRVSDYDGQLAWTHVGGSGACWTCATCGHAVSSVHALSLGCRDCGGDTWSEARTAEPVQATITQRVPAPGPVHVSAEARRVGALALVELGMLVWSDEREDSRGDAIGGIVVGIDTHARHTGYTVCRAWRGGLVVRVVTEDEMRERLVEVATPAQLAELVYALAHELGKPHVRRTGARLPLMDSRSAELVGWMHMLTGLVMG